MSTSGSANRLSTLARLVAVSDVLPAHARGAGHTTATGRHSGATVTDGGSCDILGTMSWNPQALGSHLREISTLAGSRD